MDLNHEEKMGKMSHHTPQRDSVTRFLTIFLTFLFSQRYSRKTCVHVAINYANTASA